MQYFTSSGSLADHKTGQQARFVGVQKRNWLQKSLFTLKQILRLITERRVYIYTHHGWSTEFANTYDINMYMDVHAKSKHNIFDVYFPSLFPIHLFFFFSLYFISFKNRTGIIHSTGKQGGAGQKEL
uniref:Uncharacterized protein n=1 Tax=Glossina brevipalpis TaxID=37001 RepID=A0A1A9WP60_9MUSC